MDNNSITAHGVDRKQHTVVQRTTIPGGFVQWEVFDNEKERVVCVCDEIKDAERIRNLFNAAENQHDPQVMNRFAQQGGYDD